MRKWIVMMTDFGPDNTGTATMRGVAASVDSELQLTDLTNSIEPFNVWQASDELMYTEPFWPAGTVFVSVVDPGVGTSRRACVAKLRDGKYVVTPDNGTLTHLASRVGIEAVREIDETVNRLHGTEKTSVFHGRDLFAYTAARLAAGIIDFEGVGPAYPVEEIVRCDKPLSAEVCGGNLTGRVTSVSRYLGNLFTNIRAEDMEDNGFVTGERYRVILTGLSTGRTVFDQEVSYAVSFGHVEQGQALIFNGSTLYLCVALNQDSFARKYQIDPAEEWRIEVKKHE